MKRLLKITGIVIVMLLLGVIGIGAYVKIGLPDVGDPPDLKVDVTPERVEHGRYLANHVAVCMDCHSTRDWSEYAGPPKGNVGAGGEYFGPEMGFPGKFYSRNITPGGLGSWTDGEIFRAITTGVSKDGSALFPVMPYANYGQMDKEDIYDIIAYLRSLPAVNNKIPTREPEFPFNFLINTIPKSANPGTRPFRSDMVLYGKYLTMTAACVECHSQVDKGVIIPGTEFAGGRTFDLPGGTLTSANITPDAETGIGHWDMATFVQRFKQYSDSSYKSPKLGPTDMNTIMPWIMYAGMEKADLEAIYMYLQSLKPIKNPVVKYKKRAA